jgi:hypothetical protein
VVLSNQGSFTYTPVSGFVGTDTFAYKASNTAGQTGEASVSVIVGDISALTSPAQLITEFYTGYFNRAPDPAGLTFWLNAYTTPPSQSTGGINPFYQNIQQIAASFADPKQAETTALYPFLANPAGSTFNNVVSFVTSAYQNLFGRSVTVSDTGVQYWSVAIAKSLGIKPSVFNNPVVDTVAALTPASALIALINGALGADAATIANKVATGSYYVSALNGSGVGFTAASARSALAGVTSDGATVLTAQSGINAFAFATGATQLPGPAISAGLDADSLSFLGGGALAGDGGPAADLSAGVQNDPAVLTAGLASVPDYGAPVLDPVSPGDVGNHV